jgi:adenosylhomocysteine nucleosidase
MAPVIALVVALPAESRALMGRATSRMVDGWPLQELSFPDGPTVICIRCGIGMDRAGKAADFLAAQGISMLGSVGLAGGLARGLRAGALVVTGSVAEVIGFEHLQPPRVIWTVAKDIYSFLTLNGFDAHVGTILSSRHPVLIADVKKRLNSLSGALAVDMESAAVAATARRAGVPFFALRTVCDTCDQSLPPELFTCLKENGQVRFSHLIHTICRRPMLIKDLLATGKSYRTALTSLKTAWRMILENHQTLLVTRQPGQL